MPIDFRTLDKKHFAMGVAGLSAALMLLCSLLIPGQSNFLQEWLYDQAQRHAHTEAPTHVVVVAIDDASKARLGQWPWSNATHARLIDILHGAGAQAIAFTAPLDDSTGDPERSATATDVQQQLIQAMQQHGRVLLPLEISAQLTGDNVAAAIEPILARTSLAVDGATLIAMSSATLISSADNRLLPAAFAVGHTLEPVDRDGITRREVAAVKLGNQVLPSMSVALASAATGVENARLTRSQLMLGSNIKSTALLNHLHFLPRLNEPDSDLAVPTFSYWQVLNRSVARSNFRGKLVLVGFTEGANADRVQTAFGSIARVTLVASATESLMSGTAYSHPMWATIMQFVIALLAISLMTFAAIKLPSSMRIASALSAAAILVLIDFQLLRKTNVSLQIIPQCGALLLSAGLLEAARLVLDRGKKGSPKRTISMDTLKTLALTLHGQGQLDLAYETLRRCAITNETLELLYRLGADFERRQETRKAAQVYGYVAQHNPDFKDASQRSKQLVRSSMPLQKPESARGGQASSKGNLTGGAGKPARTETLGRYEIERQIGKGAMGVVYLGRDPKINRVVAIKAIPLAEEFEDNDLSEARNRFFREAEMAGRLNHPTIVTIFDAGEERGLAYIAMEFIQGEHLSYYTDPQRLLPVRKVLSMVVRMAEALHYAHRQNVVHRDIKPANIMFNIETDALKITDFGIARLADVSRTKTGIVLGTPSFMSPEQLEGRSLDGRSDLFALGVTMYQLLTGMLPFRADSMTQLMNNIATEPHAAMRSVRPELPASLDDIVDRVLAKSAEDRYQNGSELAEAIRTCMRTIAP